MKCGPFIEIHSKYTPVLGLERLREEKQEELKNMWEESNEELRGKKKENQFLHVRMMDRDRGGEWTGEKERDYSTRFLVVLILLAISDVV